MTPIDRARKALEGWEPRCQRMYPGSPGAFSPGFGRLYPEDPKPCGYQRRYHGTSPDFIKKHVGPEHDHPFTYDPALDTSPEAALAALLAEMEAATAREATLREHLAMATDALDVWVSGSHRVTGGRCPHRADGPCTSHRVLAECRAALAPAPEADR